MSLLFRAVFLPVMSLEFDCGVYINQPNPSFSSDHNYMMNNMKHQSKPTFISFSVSFVLRFSHWIQVTVGLVSIKPQPITKRLGPFRVNILPPSSVKAQEVGMYND